jgi:hypothetical protein
MDADERRWIRESHHDAVRHPERDENGALITRFAGMSAGYGLDSK